MEEAALVTAAMRGDTEAFGQLARRYQRALIASARYITGDADDAEDLAQETLVKAFRQLPALRAPAKFRAWLFAILRHTCFTHLERRPPATSPLDECRELPGMPVVPNDDTLIAAIERLPAAYREVLVARYLQELDYAEMAQALGGTPQAMRTRCSRAREMLREYIRQADEEEARRLLQRAMAILPLGSADLFTHRVLQEVNSMNLSEVASATKSVATKRVGLDLKLGAKLVSLKIEVWKLTAGAAALLAVGGTVTGVAPFIHHGFRHAIPLATNTASLPGTAVSASVGTPTSWSHTFPGGTTVMLVGVSNYAVTNQAWETPNGASLATPPPPIPRGMEGNIHQVADPAKYRLLYFTLDNERCDYRTDWGVGNAYSGGEPDPGGFSDGHGGWEPIDMTALSQIPKMINLRFYVADGPWQTIATVSPAHPRTTFDYPEGGKVFHATMSFSFQPGGSRVTIDNPPPVLSDMHDRTAAYTFDESHNHSWYNGCGSTASMQGPSEIVDFTGSPAASDVREVAFKTRPYRHYDIPNVRVSPG